jgi:hypothetical protein
MKKRPPTSFLGSSMVERSAVNRNVVGSSPTRGAKPFKYLQAPEAAENGDSRPTVGTFVGMLLHNR